MADILWLLNTPDGFPRFVDRLASYRFDLQQQSFLEIADLARYDAVVLTMHSDQRHLQKMSKKLEDYLAAGGSVIFNGHVAHPFLPVLKPFYPVVQKGLDSLRIHIEVEHPLFAGLGEDDLTFQRGVAGFYSRGCNPAPEGAEILTTVGVDHVPVDWIYSYGSGRLFVHTGNDLFSFILRADPEGLGVLDRFFGYFAGVRVA